MATYDITSNSFNIEDIIDGDILNCPYTGSQTQIELPAGTYRLTCVGASGNWGGNKSTTNATYTRVGGGGTSVGTLELEDDTVLYINVGGCGSTYTGTSTSTRNGGYNGGGNSNAYGGVGGGATHIATVGGLLSALSSNQSAVIIVAGGGGGSNYYSGNSTYYGNGGSGGGTSGAAGTKSGSANTQYCGQGGTQSNGGAAGTSSSRKGTAGSFGQGGSNTSGTSSYASSAGGGGWYGGGAGSNEESGGGGGSGYVNTTLLTDASTTQGSATSTYTNGSVTIQVIELSGGSNRYDVSVSLSGGNFIDGHERGTYQIKEGRSDTFNFIPLNASDPVKIFRNDVDVSSSVTTQTITNSITVNAKSDASYGFTLDASDNYYKSQNKGQANSSALCRVNVSCIQQSTLRFTVISYTEEDYDIGVIGKLDTELSNSYTEDTVGFWNSMGHNSQSEQTVDIPCPPGDHFVDVKYIKDPATDSGNDQFYFKLQILPLTSDSNFIYTYVLDNVIENTTLRIQFGDVTKNMSVLSSGEHVYLNPSGEASVYKGDNYQLQITPEDETEWIIDKVLDNNVDVTSSVVAPHYMPDGTYEVQEYPGASYGFTLTNGYYQSTNTASKTASLCKVVFTTSVRSKVTLTYQSTYYSSSSAYWCGYISEVNASLRTDSAVDTSGYAWRQYDTKTSVTTDTDFEFEVPAGTNFVTIKYANDTSSSSNSRNMKFKVKSIEPLEDLYIPYYTYDLSNVQVAHNIIVVTKQVPRYNVTVTASEFGAVDKMGVNVVKEGQSLTLVCTPNTNYITDKIFVNSNSVSFSNNTYTLSNVQNDANIYVLFTTGNVQFYYRNGNTWTPVIQAYKKVNGRWEEIEFTLVGDPNAKYIRKN